MDQANPPTCFRLDWDRTSVLVTSPEPRLIEPVARLLALSLGRQGGNSIDPAHISIDRRGNKYVLETVGRQFEFESETDLVLRLLNLVGTHFLRQCPYPVLHCSGLIVDDEAVIFSGAARIGKSSLAFTGLEMGYQLLGDDMIVLDGRMVRPFPKALKLRVSDGQVPTCLQNLDLPDSDSLTGWLEDERRLVIGRRLPGFLPYEESRQLRRLYLLERGPRTKVLPASADYVLKHAFRQVLYSRSQSLEAARFLKEHWLQGKISRLIVGEGDFAHAVELMVLNKNHDQATG